MNKHPAIFIATFAILFVFVQIMRGRLTHGNTWKQAIIFALFGVIFGIIAMVLIFIFERLVS